MAKVDTVVFNIVRSYLDKLTRLGIHISKAYIFGSYAKGRADKWSDIDVAIVSPQITGDRFEERIKFMELAVSIDSRIEPLPFSSHNFVDDDPLVREIKNEGIPVAS
jgi:uncharacterized protein